MLYFWSILFVWNCASILANFIREQGSWNLMTLISVITAGISLGEVLHYYKKKKK